MAPIGGTGSPGEATEAFFLSYLAFPVVIAFYIVGYLWKRTGPKKASEIDLVTGRKCWSTAEELNAWVSISMPRAGSSYCLTNFGCSQRESKKQLPFFKRMKDMLFG